MEEDLLDREKKVGMYICVIMLIAILSLIAYCNIFMEAKGSEKSWTAKYINVVATAYCLCQKCTGKNPHDGKTATGTDAYQPGIAVDKKIIPYGSRIDCSEYSRKPTWCVADDCSEPKNKGGKIHGYHIDLRLLDHQEALNFGRQKIRIRVWTPE